jgi:hypothetical protein
MEKHKARCILLNTGWSGGGFGTGKRISIKDTRALLNAALRGDLDEGKVEYETHPIFNMKMPRSCPGVDSKILNPRNTWNDKAAYDAGGRQAARHVPQELRRQGLRQARHRAGHLVTRRNCPEQASVADRRGQRILVPDSFRKVTASSKFFWTNFLLSAGAIGGMHV